MADPTSTIRALAIRPGLDRLLVDRGVRRIITTPPPLPPQPAPPPPTPVLPAPADTNPFASLPFRSPGDRIKADDFNALAKGLQIIGDLYVLSGVLFGLPFAQARSQLAAQQYEIDRVMTVFGTEVSSQTDPSLDSRRVIQVVPATLGARRVMIVVTESVETRRLAPNLLGLTYAEAVERQRAAFGEGTFPTVAMTAAPLVGRSLAEAQQILNQ